MMRSGLAIVALGLLALFGYFFMTSSREQSGAERVKQAAVQVGDTVVDQGVAGLVRGRLATTFGLDGARFLHVHFDQGRVLIYGLLPPEVSAEELAAVVREVPKVDEVDVQAMARPAYLNAPSESEGEQPSDDGG